MAHLRRGQILVEDGQVGLALADERGQLLELALGQKRGRVRPTAALDQAIDDFATRRVGQALELGQRGMTRGRPMPAAVPDQNGPLAAGFRLVVRDVRVLRRTCLVL